ncbi:accessory Sec system protein Asp1, partial [Streptococcus sp. DD11]|uniref:accessory Sec system protein Asp1 n=1 Tax=Streptococcus sp. DD11 TaxID=1777879 RepID=UPI00100861CF
MYYFIPSWSGSGERVWQWDIIPWYRSMQRLEFDDSIHQIRIFQSQQLPVKMLLPAYMPHARYFLHRQDLFETDYYSVFDDIQGVHSDFMQALQIKDLDWEADCEFLYTPFLVMVRRQGQLYAHIEFGIEGFLSFIRFFKDDQQDKLYIFDDRGFISSITYYENGQERYRDYLQPDGDWRIREHLTQDDCRVEVNPAYLLAFDKLEYERMPDLILEKLGHFISSQAGADSKFVLAAHPLYNRAVLQLLPPQAQKILSFFHERNRELDWSSLAADLQLVDLVLTDRMDVQAAMKSCLPQQAHKVHYLSPFDTRLQLGKSQRKRESKIFYQLNLEEPINDYAIFKVLFYVAKHPETELTIGVYNAWQEGLQTVEAKVEELIDEYLNRHELIKHYRRSEQAENALLENQEQELRYCIKNITDELTLIQELEYTRLIVDLNEHPNLYTQIAGISAGIPQINLVPSDYVTHLRNGYILTSLSDLPAAADYYLDGLKHWNQALIYSIEKIRENTGMEL